MKAPLLPLAFLSFVIVPLQAATTGTWTAPETGFWGSSHLQGWSSVTTPTGSASFNADAIPNMGTGSWTLSSSYASASARWDFAGGNLAVGQTLEIDWKNPSAFGLGGEVKFTLNQSDHTPAVAFRYLYDPIANPDFRYQIMDEDGDWVIPSMMAGVQNSALQLTIQILSSTEFRFLAIRKSDSFELFDYTGTFYGGSLGSGLSYFEITNFAEASSSNELSVNNISVIPEPTVPALFLLGIGLVCLRARHQNRAA